MNPSTAGQELARAHARAAQLLAALADGGATPREPGPPAASSIAEQVGAVLAWVGSLTTQVLEFGLELPTEPAVGAATPRQPAEVMARLDELEVLVESGRRDREHLEAELHEKDEELARFRAALSFANATTAALAGTATVAPTAPSPRPKTGELLVELLAQSGGSMTRAELLRRTATMGISESAATQALYRLKNSGGVRHDEKRASYSLPSVDGVVPFPASR